MVSANQNRLSIRFLIDDNGNKLQTYSQISSETLSFFQQLIGTKDDGVSSCP